MTESLHLRFRAHAHRALRRRAVQRAHRRPRRDPHPGADGAQRGRRLGGARRSDPRLRQPGRRGQPQRRAHGAAAGRAAAEGSGRDGEPAVRLGAGRGRHRGTRDPRRRDRPRHRRRRRKHEPRAAGDAQATAAFSRHAEIHDTTIGWRFINPPLAKIYGTDSMPETAENVAREHKIARADQDAFALRSQSRAARAVANGFFDGEIVPVPVVQKRETVAVARATNIRAKRRWRRWPSSTPFTPAVRSRRAMRRASTMARRRC